MADGFDESCDTGVVALVLAPSLLLLSVAGLVDPRILHAALRKPGESVAHLPLCAKIVGYACWSPTFAMLGYLLVQSLANR